MTKCHRCGLGEPVKEQKFIFSQYGVWKSKVNVLTVLISPEATLLGFQMTVLLLPLHMVLFCAHTPLVSFSSYKSSRHIGFSPHPNGSFNLITSLKTLFLNMATFWITGGWNINMWITGGHNSAHNIDHKHEWFVFPNLENNSIFM